LKPEDEESPINYDSSVLSKAYTCENGNPAISNGKKLKIEKCDQVNNQNVSGITKSGQNETLDIKLKAFKGNDWFFSQTTIVGDNYTAPQIFYVKDMELDLNPLYTNFDTTQTLPKEYYNNFIFKNLSSSYESLFYDGVNENVFLYTPSSAIADKSDFDKTKINTINTINNDLFNIKDDKTVFPCPNYANIAMTYPLNGINTDFDRPICVADKIQNCNKF